MAHTWQYQTKWFTSTTTSEESTKQELVEPIMIRKCFIRNTVNKIQRAHFDHKLVWKYLHDRITEHGVLRREDHRSLLELIQRKIVSQYSSVCVKHVKQRHWSNSKTAVSSDPNHYNLPGVLPGGCSLTLNSLHVQWPEWSQTVRQGQQIKTV